MVRDALNKNASTMDAEAIFGSGKTDLIAKVQADVQDQVKHLGITIEKIYWIGSIRLPDTLMKAINSKIEATQRAQQRENELQTAAAQAQIEREKARGEADAILIQAEGQAKANRLLSDSLSDRLVDYKALDRWDGKLPQVSGGATPFVDLRK
jgi:regulator of protease activity HflC (stomatin/prohibitin superfamily)